MEGIFLFDFVFWGGGFWKDRMAESVETSSTESGFSILRLASQGTFARIVRARRP